VKNKLYFLIVLVLIAGAWCLSPMTVGAQSDTSVQTDSTEDDELFEDLLEDEMDANGGDAGDTQAVSDPLIGWNKAMYHFNDKLYFGLLKPLASGYKKVLPSPVRVGVKNFFHNIKAPIRFVSCILQGKPQAAGGEVGRFIVNSTAGVLGLGNPARKIPELNPNEEDLGQTFGHWGIDNGFYIVWPFLGPSTFRDSVGMAGDYFLDPVSYVNPFLARLGITSFDYVNQASFRIGDYEALTAAALDPYSALRNAYIQYRLQKVSE
jgi:phospholipid-binding lipoprotein MlaA